MRPYLLALDQGTASSRAILFDREQHIVAQPRRNSPSTTPGRAGWSTTPWKSGPPSTA